MIILNVTDTDFIALDVEEANRWLNDNIGSLVHDDWDCSYGDGWRLEYEPNTHSWLLQIQEESKAILFQLRWD